MRNDIVESVKLDLSRNRAAKVVYVRVNDTKARTLVITLTNNGQLVDLTEAVFGALYVKKPNGNENENTLIRDGNTLRYTLRTQDVDVVGTTEAQVAVQFKDGSKLMSPVFQIDVYGKITEGTTETENTYDTLEDMVAEARRYADEAADSAEESHITEDLVEEAKQAAQDAIEAASIIGTDVPQAVATITAAQEDIGYKYDVIQETYNNNSQISRDVEQTKENVSEMWIDMNHLKDRMDDDVSEAEGYKDSAEASALRAEEAVKSVGTATTEHIGLVKPDGDTIQVDEDGVISSQAGATANEAKEMAQSAQNTADDAKSTADDAKSDVERIWQSIDTVPKAKEDWAQNINTAHGGEWNGYYMVHGAIEGTFPEGFEPVGMLKIESDDVTTVQTLYSAPVMYDSERAYWKMTKCWKRERSTITNKWTDWAEVPTEGHIERLEAIEEKISLMKESFVYPSAESAQPTAAEIKSGLLSLADTMDNGETQIRPFIASGGGSARYVQISKLYNGVFIARVVAYGATDETTYRYNQGTWDIRAEGEIISGVVCAGQASLTTNVAVTSAKWKSLASITLPKGKWLVEVWATFGGNATGIRQVTMADTKDASGSTVSKVQANTSTDSSTWCQGVITYNVATSTPITRYVSLYQNSGTTLNSTLQRIQATRLA